MTEKKCSIIRKHAGLVRKSLFNNSIILNRHGEYYKFSACSDYTILQ